MREKFELLEIELIEFDDADVITTSNMSEWDENETEMGA